LPGQPGLHSSYPYFPDSWDVQVRVILSLLTTILDIASQHGHEGIQGKEGGVAKLIQDLSGNELGPRNTSASNTQQDTLFCQGTTSTGAEKFSFRQKEMSKDSQQSIIGYIGIIYTSYLLNCKSSNPTYRENPQEMAELLVTSFTFQCPPWEECTNFIEYLAHG
jgi:hypothetical protein